VALKSSKVTIEEFLRSSVWADLKDILKARVELNRKEITYEPIDDESVWVDVRRTASARARLGELGFLLRLPEYLLEQWEVIHEMEEEVDKDGRE